MYSVTSVSPLVRGHNLGGEGWLWVVSSSGKVNISNDKMNKIISDKETVCIRPAKHKLFQNGRSGWVGNGEYCNVDPQLLHCILHACIAMQNSDIGRGGGDLAENDACTTLRATAADGDDLHADHFSLSPSISLSNRQDRTMGFLESFRIWKPIKCRDK